MRNTGKAMPMTELDTRIRNLQSSLQNKGLDGALIVQKTDLFYFSGTAQQGWLFVPASGDPILMVNKDFERAKTESPLPHIISLLSPKGIVGCLSDFGFSPVKKLGMELDVVPVNLFNQYRKLFSGVEIDDISNEIRLIRAVKSAFEIDKMKKAAQYSDLVAAKAEELLVVGKSEVTLAGELEGYARSLGHQGIVRMRMWNNELFYGHLMAGEAAAVPSYLASPTGGEGVSAAIGQGAGFKKIKEKEPVLVDYVFALDGYLSDHARIFSLGTIQDRLLSAHDDMLEIQEQIKSRAKPGVLSGDLYEFMTELAAQKGYGDHFMGVGDRRIRFTGHGVGLELDEYPFLAKGQKLPLEEGMVFALEPKCIFPGLGVVGIENTHLVTEGGLVPLTTYPDTICNISA